MDVDVMLCEHAVTAEGKLYINGAAINVFTVGPMPPHVLTFSIGAVVHVPWTATNQPHTLTASLVDEDGRAVEPALPDGMPSPGPVRVQAAFNVGRPATIASGDIQDIALSFQMQGLPLANAGAYSISIEIDNTEVRRLPFRLTVSNPTTTGFGGPSMLPPMR